MRTSKVCKLAKDRIILYQNIGGILTWIMNTTGTEINLTIQLITEILSPLFQIVQLPRRNSAGRSDVEVFQRK